MFTELFKRVIPLTAISLFLLLVASDFFFSGCATRSTPSGGPRDTTAPAMDTSFPPNGSLFFKGNELIIEFSEFISLKNPGQQINFSPPLKEKPEFTLRGKELSIEWTDTLRENTTYTISFGEAIQDFTEGNVNDRMKFVFSTGSYIDSLRLRGRVIDGRTNQAEKQFLVALYEQSAVSNNDSIPFLEMPAYYTYTDEEGQFELENLRFGNFHVIAFEDKRGNFRLNTGSEKIAFLLDSLALNDSTPPLELKSFLPEDEPRFFGAKHTGNGQIQVAFNYEPDSLEVMRIGVDSSFANDFLTWEKSSDTSTFWFEQGKLDSLVLLVKADELSDTSTIFLRPFKKKKLEIKAVSESVPFYQSFQFETDRPLLSAEAEMLRVISKKDTLQPDSVVLTAPKILSVFPRRRPKELTIYFMEGAITGFDGNSNDSTMIKQITLKRDELGTVLFRVNTSSEENLILLIKDAQGIEIRRENFLGKTNVELKNELPGLYSAEIIIDKNGDGQWTTGDYLSRRKPEPIIKYDEQIEVRANWELELVWEPDLRD
jgi:uncharacterized protein (DUF2141 family)